MAGKEDVEKIRQIVGVAYETRLSRVAAQAAAEARTKAEVLRQKEKAEEDLRRTGVVALFEALRDEGVVKWSDEPVYTYKTRKVSGFLTDRVTSVRTKVQDYMPARVSVYMGSVGKFLGMDVCKVGLFFNHVNGERESYSECYIKAYVDRGLLVVEGCDKWVVGKNLSMAEAVGKAISSPGENDQAGNYWP